MRIMSGGRMKYADGASGKMVRAHRREVRSVSTSAPRPAPINYLTCDEHVPMCPILPSHTNTLFPFPFFPASTTSGRAVNTVTGVCLRGRSNLCLSPTVTENLIMIWSFPTLQLAYWPRRLRSVMRTENGSLCVFSECTR